MRWIIMTLSLTAAVAGLPLTLTSCNSGASTGCLSDADCVSGFTCDPQRGCVSSSSGGGGASIDASVVEALADEGRLPALVETGQPDDLTTAVAEAIAAEMTEAELGIIGDIDWETADAGVFAEPAVIRLLEVTAPVIDQHLAAGSSSGGQLSQPLVSNACAATVGDAASTARRVIRTLLRDGVVGTALALACYGALNPVTALPATALCAAGLAFVMWGAILRNLTNVATLTEALGRIKADCPGTCGTEGDTCCATVPRCEPFKDLTCNLNDICERDPFASSCSNNSDCEDGYVCDPTLGCIEQTDGIPAGWTCAAEYYGTQDGCDCDCGVLDIDCQDPSQEIYNCEAGQEGGSDGTCRDTGGGCTPDCALSCGGALDGCGGLCPDPCDGGGCNRGICGEAQEVEGTWVGVVSVGLIVSTIGDGWDSDETVTCTIDSEWEVSVSGGSISIEVDGYAAGWQGDSLTHCQESGYRLREGEWTDSSNTGIVFDECPSDDVGGSVVLDLREPTVRHPGFTCDYTGNLNPGRVRVQATYGAIELIQQ